MSEFVQKYIFLIFAGLIALVFAFRYSGRPREGPPAALGLLLGLAPRLPPRRLAPAPRRRDVSVGQQAVLSRYEA